ncbi:ATP-dependent zinc metalloprotease FtsH [Candidatus Parcubacteria bacterium]|nr:ATP-dependent zinc metalloprotease FtsH [Candidatus Parcubacteria bacterium]
MKEFLKNFIVAVLIFIFLSFLFGRSFLTKKEPKILSLTQLVSEINQEKVKEIKIGETQAIVRFSNEEIGIVEKEVDSPLTQTLINLGADKEKLQKVNIVGEKRGGLMEVLVPIILYLVSPLLFFILFFWWLSKQAKGGPGQIFDFTKARVRILGPGGEIKEKISFKDVAGLKEAKEELSEVIDFLKHPKKYLELGAKVPRGILLIGPPGCGKTMLAKAVATESGVPFLAISGSEFIELFVGVGSSRIRSLFEQARRLKKAIIFIDEIDSIGKLRGVGVTGGHEEREQTLNQLLAEMDGIGREEGIIVMGATNKPEVLDPALLRPGRFDRRIVLDLPDLKDREEILKVHTKNKPLALNVNLREIAERTPGFSGADLANLVNEAALLAARRNKKQIHQEELIEAIEKVLLGPERKSHLLTKKEKEIAAWHEAGHAIVSAFLRKGEPVRKVSIVARGLAAGYTLKTPKEERKIKTKSELLAEIASLLGGYLSELLKFKEVSVGAANDLKLASELARKMVKDYGMSDLGPITFGEKEELVFLGVQFEVLKNYSEKLAQEIDKEVTKIINQAKEMALKILKKKRKILDRVAQKLIEKETIEKEEFEKLIGRL